MRHTFGFARLRAVLALGLAALPVGGVGAVAWASAAAGPPDLAIVHVNSVELGGGTYDVTWRVSVTEAPAPSTSIQLHVGTPGASIIDVFIGGQPLSCVHQLRDLVCSMSVSLGTPVEVVQRVRVGDGGRTEADAHVGTQDEVALSNNTAYTNVGTQPPPPAPPPPPPAPPAPPVQQGFDWDVSLAALPPIKARVEEEFVVTFTLVLEQPGRNGGPAQVNLLLKEMRNARLAGGCRSIALNDGTVMCPGGPLVRAGSRLQVSLRFVADELTPLTIVAATTVSGLAFEGEDRVPANSTASIRLDVVQPAPYRVIGSPKRDHLVGGPYVDVLDGGAGADTIFAGGGNDTLYGRAGNDVLRPGTGRDKAFGGGGDDTIAAADSQSGDRIACGAGRDRVIADKGDIVARDCEVIRRH